MSKEEFEIIINDKLIILKDQIMNKLDEINKKIEEIKEEQIHPFRIL